MDSGRGPRQRGAERPSPLEIRRHVQLWQPHMSKDLEVDKSWVPEEWLPALGLTLAVEMDSHTAWGHLAASLGGCSSVLQWR